MQKALDSTLFSGFEGAIRHLWSRSEQLKYFLKNIGIKKISAKECSALQKALDNTLFSGFEGAIRHLWSRSEPLKYFLNTSELKRFLQESVLH